MSYTPFGALIARQIHNATSVESAKSAGSGGGIALGRHGKSTVKEVSLCYCLLLNIVLMVESYGVH